jgi:hypothetical protein
MWLTSPVRWINIYSKGFGLKKRIDALSRLISAFALLFVFAGCATSTQMEGRGAEQIVAERALVRWQHLIKGEFDKAYVLLSPSYRSAVSESQYRSTFKPGMWRGVEVKSVKCDEPDVCQVDVEIEFQFAARSAGVISGKRILPEVWRKDMGEWWNVPDLR